MDVPPGSRSTMERWIALLVRYWSVNMTMAFRSGGYWPGFGYSAEEKAEMAYLGQNCSFGQFLAWAFIVALIVMPVVAVVMIPGIYLLSSHTAATLPGSVFFLSEGAAIVVCFTIGMPVAMLLGSALVGRLYKIPDSELPDRATTARYLSQAVVPAYEDGNRDDGDPRSGVDPCAGRFQGLGHPATGDPLFGARGDWRLPAPTNFPTG